MRIVLLFAFFSLTFLFFKPPTDPDLFWHLRQGEEILKTGQIPYQDQFSFTFTGYRAADSWWLSEVLIYYLVGQFGFLLPVLLFAFLGATTFLAVGLGGRVGKGDVLAVLGAAFLGATVSSPILGLRPQTISLVFFGLVFILLNQFWSKGRPKLVFFIPLIFLFWANFHAGFVLGLVLIWLFWGAEGGRFLLQKFLKSKERKRPFLAASQLKTLLAINLISSFLTLVNPYEIGLWQTVLNDATSPTIKNQIVEWLAPNFHSELGLFFLFYLLLLVILAYLEKLWIHPTRFLLLLVFALFALAAVRHISFFALLATPFLAEELTNLPWKKIDFSYKYLALSLFFLVFSLAWAVQSFPRVFESTRDVKGLATVGNYPYEAVEYLKRHPREKIFSQYGWGGYLIWQLPQSQTFIDGRMPGWKREGRQIMDEYDKINNLEEDLEEALDFWRIEAFLLPLDVPLVRYLEIHSGWQEEYRDKQTVIFVQKT